MAATDIERLVVQIEGQTAKFDKALSRLEGQSRSSMRRVETTINASTARMNNALSRVGLGLKGALGGGFAALVGALGVREIAAFSDAWTRATNSLKVAGLSGDQLTSTMDALYAAAQRQGAPLEALTTLYGRFAAVQKDLGATSQEGIQFSEDVATALRVAGTSAQDASGALLQLGQLLGSSRVQAEEFNSVNEGARPILQAVANGIEEAGGSVSKLKQLVTQGKLSNTAFFKGFQVGVQTIRDQAATAEPTIGQAFERVQNALTKMVGELDKTTGASSNFVTNMGNVVTAIDAIPGAVNRAADALADLQKWLNGVGNSPFWERLGRFLGADYSGAEMLRNGFGQAPNQAALNAHYAALGQGSGRPGGIGSDPDRNLARPIKAADYPVNGAAAKSPKDTADEYDRATESITKNTAALQLETETLGQSAYAIDYAKTKQELLNAAKEAGREITPALTAEIESEAQAHAQATAQLEKAQDAQQQLNQLQQEFGNLGISSIEGLIDGSKSLNDVLKDTLKLIEEMILKAILLGQGPLGGLLGGSSGGLIGSLTKGLSSSGGSIGLYATGGQVRGPGTSRSDSIPAMLSNGEFVVNAKMAKRYGALLEAINTGSFRLPHFATGGPVGVRPASGGMGEGLSVQVVNQTGVTANGRADVKQGSNGRQIVQVVLDAVKQDYATGGFDNVNRARFGSKPAPVTRG